MVSKATVRISWAATAWVMAWDSANGVIPSAAARVSACRRLSRPIKIWSSSIRIALDSLTVVRSFLFVPLPVRRRRRRGSPIACRGAAPLRVLSRLGPPARVLNVLTHRLCGRRAIPLAQRGQNRLVLVRGLPPRGLSGRAGQETCAGQRSQAGHQREEQRIPGCLVDDLVEGQIGSEKGFGIGRTPASQRCTRRGGRRYRRSAEAAAASAAPASSRTRTANNSCSASRLMSRTKMRGRASVSALRSVTNVPLP